MTPELDVGLHPYDRTRPLVCTHVKRRLRNGPRCLATNTHASSPRTGIAQPIATLTAHRKELGYSEPWGSGTPGDVVDAGSPQLVMSALAYAVDWGSTARASADPTSGDSERLGAVLHGHFPCL